MVAAMDEALEGWFVREILAHEGALTRYLARAWSNAADVADLRQEVYVKVLEAAEKARPASPKYFLFAVARNHVADRGRRSRIVPIDFLQDCDSLNVLMDEMSPERRMGSFQQLERLLDAFENLPDRCREVVWLRKIEDLAQKEIARRLNIAEGTVEAHLVRGMRLLTRWFYQDETADAASPEREKADRESQRGR
jgi:RNA polymerase sigma factor (sigma-70 family)